MYLGERHYALIQTDHGSGSVEMLVYSCMCHSTLASGDSEGWLLPKGQGAECHNTASRDLSGQGPVPPGLGNMSTTGPEMAAGVNRVSR